jgi:hypothetical protein
MAQVDAIKAIITADDAQFQQAVERSKKATKSFSDQIVSLGKTLAVAGTAAASAGLAITTALVKQGLTAVDAQAKLARQVGGTTAAIQGLDRAARLNGVSSGVMSSALGSLNQRLAEAQTGTGTAAKALQRLNLDARELSRMDADERMATLADAMRGLPASQVAYELRELGIRGKEMAVLMQEGGDAIRQAAKEARGLGLAVNEIDAENIQAANDAMQDVRDAVQGVANQLAGSVAPLITAVAELFSDAAMESGGFREQIDQAVDIGIKGFGLMANVVRGLQVVVMAIRGAVAEVFNVILQGVAQVGKGFNEILNLIPGREAVNFDDTFIGGMAASFSETVKGFRAELLELMGQPLPAEMIEQSLQAIRERANQVAAEVIEQRRANQAKELEEAVAQEEALTEIQVNAKKIRRDLDAEYYALVARQAEEAAEREKKAKQDVVDTARRQFASGFSALGQHSKKMFQLNKIAGISDALISTAQGAAAALKLGWPLGPIAAAAITTQGLGRVAAIRAQTFSAGGTAGAGGTPAIGEAAAPMQQAAPQQPQQTLTVRGIDANTLVAGADVRILAERLLDYQRDGGRVVFA